eukprot:COSAG04_NODE_7988_length_1038_cov_1.488818_2_plen_121_part_00
MSAVQAEAIGTLPARTRELTNAGLCDQLFPIAKRALDERADPRNPTIHFSLADIQQACAGIGPPPKKDGGGAARAPSAPAPAAAGGGGGGGGGLAVQDRSELEAEARRQVFLQHSVPTSF